MTFKTIEDLLAVHYNAMGVISDKENVEITYGDSLVDTEGNPGIWLHLRITKEPEVTVRVNGKEGKRLPERV